jgi:sigma-B regulation protein RsbU (phosphoserine phosphatase)
MARLFWDRGAVRAHSQGEFEPAEYREVLARLSALTGTRLEFRQGQDVQGTGGGYCAVRLGGRRTGWVVAASEETPDARRAADTAAEVVSRLLTAEQDTTSLATELADRYEELNFLYEMSSRVGALLDEDQMCAFVVEEAAWLMNCERASIMVADPETDELKIRAAVGLPEDISDDVTVRPGEGISGKVFESGHGVIVNAGDPMPADSLNVSELKESNCFLSVPLKISSPSGGEGRVVGVFNLTRKRGGSMFTASDQKLVSAVAATTATQIHNCRLMNAERQRQNLEHELELAARIQLRLLPEGPIHVGAMEAGGLSKPARHVGGDLFDYWVQEDRLCLVVADVSGHDLGAALMATAFRSVMRSEAFHRRSVADLMALANKALFTDLVNAELFISVFYAEVEVATGNITFCRAGHPKPLLIRPGQEVWLDTEGSLLGISEDGQFEQQSVRLNDGDTAVLYTDGLMEAMDSDGRSFGTNGVRNASLDHLSSPPQQVAEGIVDAARAHTGAAPLMDDMTVLVARFGNARGR